MNIKFKSYDGEYPNLCHGRLIVEIDGKEISFGFTTPGFGISEDKLSDYPRFWSSGGAVSFDEDWSEYVSSGPWELTASEKDYPPEIWKILPDIIDIMNEKVPWGCCGGCV